MQSARLGAARAHVVEGTRVGVVAPGSQKEELWLEYTCFSSAPYPHVTEIHVYAMALIIIVLSVV